MEWAAMPFGLDTVHVTFKRMSNDIMRDLLHKFVNLNLDDVCVCNRTSEEHLEHMRHVLQRFKVGNLKLRLKQCFFGLPDMEYLGYTLSNGKISTSTKV
jgi:hypothetical protein